jgi:hypothetical protein
MKDSFISKIKVSRGGSQKVTRKDQLNAYGWLPEDHDIDKDESGHMLPRRERPHHKKYRRR